MAAGKEEWSSFNLDEHNRAVLYAVPKQYSLNDLKKISLAMYIVECSFIAIICKLQVQCADNLGF